MVRIYKTMNAYLQCTEEGLKNAIRSVLQGYISMRGAAAQFKIPFTTIYRRVREARLHRGMEKTILTIKCLLQLKNELVIPLFYQQNRKEIWLIDLKIYLIVDLGTLHSVLEEQCTNTPSCITSLFPGMMKRKWPVRTGFSHL